MIPYSARVALAVVAIVAMAALSVPLDALGAERVGADNVVAAAPKATPTAKKPAPAKSGGPKVKPVGTPTITNVYPPAPYANQPVELVLYGTGFSEDQANVVVTLGDAKATSVEVNSPRRLKAYFPALGKAGVASVTITNPDGESHTFARAVYLCPASGFDWTAMRFQIRYDWRGFVEWFKLGGPLMYVFLLISFFGLAWVVHCALVLRRSQILPQKFMEAVSSHLAQSDLPGAAAACEQTRCAFGRVLQAGMRKAMESPEKVREAVGAAGSRESAHLLQKISYLANVGTISPMLGLLGTVFGMIMAFNIISSGEVRPYLLAAAIAQAMVTTAAGLVIGIPALAVYFYLRGRLLRLVTHMEVVADEVAETIIEKAEEA